MKRLLFVSLAALGLSACNQEASLESEEAKFSYALGMDVGGNVGPQIQAMGVELDEAAFFEAMRTAMKSGESRLTPEQIAEVKETVFKRLMEKKVAEMKAVGEANKKAGEKFLTENGKRAGVKSTASGLQYEVVSEGSGAKPAATDTVKVHYRGTTLDGKEFDSSYKRNEPAQFPLNGVIAGWTEGVQLMTVGSKYKFYIPSDLAYGPQGNQGIEPNSTLIFEVELLDIVKEKQAKQ